MSHEDRIKQIQNGLQIVELVEKIRKENKIQPSYGRSAIGLPSTKDRTSAWELFHKVALDADRHEEGIGEEGDSNTPVRDDSRNEHDDDGVDSRGERTYKESTWDDDEPIILENSLASNIQQNDSGRKNTYRFTNNQNDDCRSGKPCGSTKGNGCVSHDQANMSSILENHIPPERIVEGADQKRGFVMNPNAKEYVPKMRTTVWSANDGLVEAMGSSDRNNNVRDNIIPPAKPVMQKKIINSDKYSDVQIPAKPIPVPKKRSGVIVESAGTIEPIDNEPEYEDMEGEGRGAPTSTPISMSPTTPSTSSSQETVFNLSDIVTDNDRRNMISDQSVKALDKQTARERKRSKSSDHTYHRLQEKTGSEARSLSEGRAKSEKKTGKKLRALSNTDAGMNDYFKIDNEKKCDVKKGTDENTVCPGMVQKSGSKNGATLHAPGLNHVQQERDASAGHAPDTVNRKIAQESSMKQNKLITNHNNETGEENSNPEAASFDDYYNNMIISIPQEEIMKEIYRNQLEILTKLSENQTLTSAIKDIQTTQKATISRIESLERSIGKLGLAVSSMEQMLASMRIMIPGKPTDIKSPEKTKNPMLKPVIGRETLKAEEVIDIDFESTGNSKTKGTIKKNLFIEPIDDKKTNASQFIPDDDFSTINTLYALIINRVKDTELKDVFLAALKKAETRKDIDMLYANVARAIKGKL
ncbi:phosphoprotein [Jingmen Crocidura shantungensis henipavirus 2]|nr:phosphoprotein [Jingmen Crocidura shantungensis henipavirus 2]